jgi:uncharacterized repeat protein (TIGR01451 family)
VTVQAFSNQQNQSITNTAFATGDNVPQVSDSATVNVNGNNQAGQLTITKSVRRVTGDVSFQNSINANNGDRVSFEILVRNSGNGTVNNVRITDNIPNGLTIDTGSYNLKSGEVLFKNDRIKYWISNGAQTSETIHNFLVHQKVIEGKKKNVLSKKSPTKARKELKKA